MSGHCAACFVVCAAGALQEEVFFAVAPELLLLRPLSQHLRLGEAAHASGCLRFSAYRGYAGSFRCLLNKQKGSSSSGGSSRGSSSRQHQQAQGRPQQQTDGDTAAAAAATEQAAKRGHLLLSLDSDDEGDRQGGVSGGPIPTETAAAANQDYEETEGVEALDKTPLQLQWLFPLAAAASNCQQQNPQAPHAHTKTERETETAAAATAAAEKKQQQRTLRLGPPLLRVQCSSLVAALDAARFGGSRAAQAAAAAAAAAAANVTELPGAPTCMHAAAREVLPRPQQFSVPLMLREIQKVSAALHLPREREAAAAGAAAAAAGGSAYMRPFCTGKKPTQPQHQNAAGLLLLLVLLLLLLFLRLWLQQLLLLLLLLWLRLLVLLLLWLRLLLLLLVLFVHLLLLLLLLLLLFVLVHAGNWGCGFFGGDPQLKFVLQWLACSLAGCRMQYFAWGLQQLLQQNLLQQTVAAILHRAHWGCAELWNVLIEVGQHAAAAAALAAAAAFLVGLQLDSKGLGLYRDK